MIRYFPETDTIAIELRPWPEASEGGHGGEDAGEDLVIHYATKDVDARHKAGHDGLRSCGALALDARFGPA